MDYQALAEQAVEETANIPDFAYYGDLPLGKTWAFTISINRDSTLIDKSNWEVITKDMEEKFPDDIQVEGASHWAVGWIDHFAVRMLNDDGKVTQAGLAILEWKKSLEDYPLADESHYSKLEYEATLENIKNESGVDSDVAEKIWRWLWDNNERAVENRDDQGGYPSSEEIAEALWELKITRNQWGNLEDEYDEFEEKEKRGLFR